MGSRRLRVTVAVAAVMVLASVAGCAGPTDGSATPADTPASDTTTATTTTPSRPPALDSTLYQVVTAENRSAVADQYGLEYRNGSISVVVELEAGASLPEGYDINVHQRHERLVEASVAVDDLVDLAREDAVAAIRPPTQPQMDT